jgi:hypothetical protein
MAAGDTYSKRDRAGPFSPPKRVGCGTGRFSVVLVPRAVVARHEAAPAHERGIINRVKSDGCVTERDSVDS